MQDLSYCLKVTCPDRPGIVAGVSACLLAHGGNIRDAAQFEDVETGTFFMRVVFTLPQAAFAALRAELDRLAQNHAMTIELRPRGERRRVLIVVSKFDHCLTDLLYRVRIGELSMDVVAVVSNHPRDVFSGLDLTDLAFHHLPVTPETKPMQEAALRRIIEETGAELVVLARYMQILSDSMAQSLAGRCINIHHSFLPGFKGARPYHQAHARGVKMIGASAHYVTGDLDEGPIIVQDVETITHADGPDDLIRKGRDIERRVLAKAVRYHLDDRVFLNGGKTIVFMD